MKSFVSSLKSLTSFGGCLTEVKKRVKERIVLREIHLRTTRRHLSNGITQCYLLPDRGGRPAFTQPGRLVLDLSTP